MTKLIFLLFISNFNTIKYPTVLINLLLKITSYNIDESVPYILALKSKQTNKPQCPQKS